MFIIKLGGSVITDKTKKYHFRQKNMDKLASCIKKANQKIILVHGAGSFGHIPAEKYDLNKGYKKHEQIKGFSFTHEKVQALNSLVLTSLHKYDLPAISISPHSIIKLNNHNLQTINYQIFEDYLSKGFMPISFGDVVLDKKLGFSICSGDLLTQALSGYFHPSKVIFVIDEDGLYTSNPKKDNKAEFISSAQIDTLDKLSMELDKHSDVTGGMKGKVNTIIKIANQGIDTIILNGNKPDRLYKVLIGEESKYSIVYGVKK